MSHAALLWLLATMVLVRPSYTQGVTREPNEPRDRKPEFVFDVRPRIIGAGETAVLYWSIKGATKVVIEESSISSPRLRQIGTFGANGSFEVRPSEDTTYVVSCEGSTTYSCASISVRVRVKRR